MFFIRRSLGENKGKSQEIYFNDGIANGKRRTFSSNRLSIFATLVKQNHTTHSLKRENS